MMLESAESEHPSLTNLVKVSSKNSNLCDHDTSMARTNGQTDIWMDRWLAVVIP